MTRRHPLRLLLAVYLVLVAAGLTAWIVTRILPFVLLAAGVGGWQLWRRRGITLPRPRVVQGTTVPTPPAGLPDWVRDQRAARPALRLADDRDRLAAELDDARRSIAKLEDDAADHDDLIERIERVTGRPVELHLADLERVQRQYGPAAVGKTGRRP